MPLGDGGGGIGGGSITLYKDLQYSCRTLGVVLGWVAASPRTFSKRERVDTWLPRALQGILYLWHK